MSKKYAMLVMNNAEGNNNKFYELKLQDDDSVVIRYGRVGASGVSENKGFGESTFDKVANAKRKKGYKDVQVVTHSEGVVSTGMKETVLDIAKRDIAKNDPTLHKLLTRLSEINRFQLLSASGGQIDIVDGEVKTALGVLVPLSSIITAKTKLGELNQFVTNNDLGTEYVNTLQDYLTLVPQKIQSKRGWDKNFFTEFTTYQNQYDLLEQLENSVKNSKPPEPKKDSASDTMARVFGYSMQAVEDGKVFDQINKFYTGSSNSRHVASNRKLYKIYRKACAI